MVNKFFFVLRKIIISTLFIYAYDSLICFSSHIVPINFVNIVLVSLFDVVAMFYLILFSFI